MRNSPLTFVLLVLPAVVAAQATSAPVISQSRSVTITAGGGNSYGWWGIQGERYFSRGNYSILAGVGRDGDLLHDGLETNTAFALGARAYTHGTKHRLFMELSVSEIAVEVRWDGFGTRSPRYGPGLQAGYQFTTRGGITAMISAGYGYAMGTSALNGSSRGQPLAGFGLGYTFH